jgi:hypothetical protein
MIYLYDSSFNRIRGLDIYQNLTWVRNWQKEDTFNLVINRQAPYALEIEQGMFISYGTYIGYIKTISGSETLPGADNITVSGSEYNLFGDRLIQAGTDAGTGYDSQTDNAENVIKHYLNANLTGARAIPNLSIETSDSRGTVVTYDGRFQYLSDMIYTVCQAGDIGWKIAFDGSTCTFVIITGDDRTTSQSLLPPCIFSVANGTAIKRDYVQSIVNSKTTAYVLGAGAAAARAQTIVGDANVGLDRREIMVSDENTTDATETGTNLLARLPETDKNTFFISEDSSLQYNRDWFLGDKCTAIADGNTFDFRIRTVTEIINPSHTQVILTLGEDDALNLKNITEINTHQEVY